MGKGEENNTEDSKGETKSKPEEVKEETTEEESIEKKEDTKKPEEKKNVDDLRKVIKVELSKDMKKEGGEDTNIDESSREGLEQKRAILQSIKDFDFQIKKNQEEITSVNKKLDAVSKDLDDLVSLYEIVSEQMNPFVGLSKVTKKRIDALENFTKEIEDLKTRIGDMESFAVKAGADLTNIREHRDPEEDKKHIETIEEKIKHELGDEGEVKPEDELEKTDENEPLEPEQKEPVQPQQPTPQQIPPQQFIIQPQTPISQQTTPQYEFTTVSDDFGLDEIDNIIERTLGLLSIEYQFDRVIDEFIESLKT